jgi:hypothetical protein
MKRYSLKVVIIVKPATFVVWLGVIASLLKIGLMLLS